MLTSALLTVFVAPACGSAPAATFDGHTIGTSTLNAELKAMHENEKYVAFIEDKQRGGIEALAFSDEAAPALAADVLTVEITALVVKQEFERRNVRMTATDRREGAAEAFAFAGSEAIFSFFPEWYRKEVTDRAVTRASLRRTLRGKQTPKQYYDTHSKEFATPCVRDIVVFFEKEAYAARRRILGGESFATVAQDVSRDSGTAPEGGSLGCVGRDALKPELARAAFSQKLGVVGEPIRQPEGYHLILVESRKIPPFAKAAGSVRRTIENRGRRRLDEILAGRFEAARVEINPKIGVWDGQKVVPKVLNPTPRPRPLPPIARYSKDIKNPSFHVGQELFITDKGFVPSSLTAIIDEDISFINETSAAQTVRFNVRTSLWKPTRIPAHGRVKFHPKEAWSMVVRLDGMPDATADIRVEPYFEPGEDPGAPGRLDADTPGEKPYQSTATPRS